ncbi:MAG: hypothetical protein ACO3CC_18145 [Alphaproteobacteria bacterium]
MFDAFETDVAVAASGFAAGALTFYAGDWAIARRGAVLTVHHVEANARTRAASAWVNPRSCYGQVLQQRGLPQATS